MSNSASNNWSTTGASASTDWSKTGNSASTTTWTSASTNWSTTRTSASYDWSTMITSASNNGSTMSTLASADWPQWATQPATIDPQWAPQPATIDPQWAPQPKMPDHNRYISQHQLIHNNYFNQHQWIQNLHHIHPSQPQLMHLSLQHHMTLRAIRSTYLCRHSRIADPGIAGAPDDDHSPFKSYITVFFFIRCHLKSFSNFKSTPISSLDNYHWWLSQQIFYSSAQMHSWKYQPDTNK